MRQIIRSQLLSVQNCRSSTSLDVDLNLDFTPKCFTARSAAEQFDIAMHSLVRLQFLRREETLRTFAADVWLEIMVSRYVLLKVASTNELLLASVTGEPSAFVVRQQQMAAECVIRRTTDKTVCA